LQERNIHRDKVAATENDTWLAVARATGVIVSSPVCVVIIMMSELLVLALTTAVGLPDSFCRQHLTLQLAVFCFDAMLYQLYYVMYLSIEWSGQWWFG